MVVTLGVAHRHQAMVRRMAHHHRAVMDAAGPDDDRLRHGRDRKTRRHDDSGNTENDLLHGGLPSLAHAGGMCRQWHGQPERDVTIPSILRPIGKSPAVRPRPHQKSVQIQDGRQRLTRST
jgi:hypothetical protein